jgi:ParB/RepB/Spo0J family partition protein
MACEGGCYWVEDPEGLGDLCSKCLASKDRVWQIPLDQIRPAPWNPPSRMDPEKVKGLAESIKIEGQKSAALIRPVEAEAPVKYEIVFGHRRYASKHLLAAKVDAAHAFLRAEIQEMDEEHAMILAGIENLQREGFSGIEEAEFFRTIGDRFGESAVKILSERLSLSDRYIRKRLEILKLPETALELWRSGTWHVGHMEQLLRLGDNEKVLAFLEDLDRGHRKIKDLAVYQLKDEIDKLAISLHSGNFDKQDCKACRKNTDCQRRLFGGEKDKTKCLDQKCFKEKQQAWYDLNWATCKANKYGTQAAVVGDYNTPVTGQFSSYGGGPVPTEKCKSCPKFTTVMNIRGTQQFSSQERVCLGDAACFSEVKKADIKNQRASKGKSNGEDSDAPRVPWHGEHFRQQFYASEIPRLLEILPEDDFRRLQLALAALVYSSAEVHEWFCQKVGIELPEKEEWQTYANRFPFYRLLAAARALIPMDCEKYLAAAVAKMAIDKCSYQTVFTDQDRQAIAEFLDVDFGRFRVTEEYLQKKTKAELVRFIVHDSGLMEETKFQEFIGQRGYPTVEKLAHAKKGELVDIIQHCEVDLHGRLPKEIADRPKLQTSDN